MSVFDFLNHLFNFVAPAIFLGVVLAVGARLVFPKKVHLLPWYLMACINVVLGILVLALGLVLTGQDGRMMTYALLVMALATCQWLMSSGWMR